MVFADNLDDGNTGHFELLIYIGLQASTYVIQAMFLQRAHCNVVGYIWSFCSVRKCGSPYFRLEVISSFLQSDKRFITLVSLGMMGMPRLPSWPNNGVLFTLVLILLNNSPSSYLSTYLSSCLSSCSHLRSPPSLSHIQPTHPSLPLELTHSRIQIFSPHC